MSTEKPPLTFDELRRVVVAAPSVDALTKATGGKAHAAGRMDSRNVVILEVDGRRFPYCRVQERGTDRSTGYNTSRLRGHLPDNGRKSGHDFDHVASGGVEGGKIGNRLVLMAMVSSGVNRAHGAAYERGPAPVREFNAASKAGKDGAAVAYLDRQMMMKLADRMPDGTKRSRDPSQPNSKDLATISRALMQDKQSQDKFAAMVREGGSRHKAADAVSRLPASPKTNGQQPVQMPAAIQPAKPRADATPTMTPPRRPTPTPTVTKTPSGPSGGRTGGRT